MMGIQEMELDVNLIV